MTTQELLLSHVKPDSRILSITSFTTGDPFLIGIELMKLPFFLSARYRVDNNDLDGSFNRFSVLRSEIGAMDPFDLIFVDPYHDYRFSTATINFALRIAKPSSLIFCHDCLPNPDHTSPTYVEGCWCGVTFAAFRDVALDGFRPWHVIDDDMGIGVLGMECGAIHVPLTGLDSKWEQADIAGKIELYKQHGKEVMKVRPVG